MRRIALLEDQVAGLEIAELSALDQLLHLDRGEAVEERMVHHLGCKRRAGASGGQTACSVG